MGAETFRVLELSMQGLGCSQILMTMALEEQGRENRELVRAMSGLLRGMSCGKICGALTGACCVLGLYAGQGAAEESPDSRLDLMLREMVEWFETEYIPRYESIECGGIIDNDPRLRLARCPVIVQETFEKLAELLKSHGFKLGEGRVLPGR